MPISSRQRFAVRGRIETLLSGGDQKATNLTPILKKTLFLEGGKEARLRMESASSYA